MHTVNTNEEIGNDIFNYYDSIKINMKRLFISLDVTDNHLKREFSNVRDKLARYGRHNKT